MAQPGDYDPEDTPLPPEKGTPGESADRANLRLAEHDNERLRGENSRLKLEIAELKRRLKGRR